MEVYISFLRKKLTHLRSQVKIKTPAAEADGPLAAGEGEGVLVQLQVPVLQEVGPELRLAAGQGPDARHLPRRGVRPGQRPLRDL